MQQRRLVSISMNDPDYYEWGKNCKILQYGEAQTQQVLKSLYGPNHVYAQEHLDMFWDGYHNGVIDE